MAPTVVSVYPKAVGSVGGELVRITGSGFTPQVTVTFGGVPAEVAVMVFIVERPGCNLGAGRLPTHIFEVFFTDGTVDGSERDGLVLAHRCLPYGGEGAWLKVRRRRLAATR